MARYRNLKIFHEIQPNPSTISLKVKKKELVWMMDLSLYSINTFSHSIEAESLIINNNLCYHVKPLILFYSHTSTFHPVVFSLAWSWWTHQLQILLCLQEWGYIYFLVDSFHGFLYFLSFPSNLTVPSEKMKDGHWVERLQNLKIYIQIQRRFPSHLPEHTATAVLHGPIGIGFIHSSSSGFGVMLMHRVSNKAA